VSRPWIALALGPFHEQDARSRFVVHDHGDSGGSAIRSRPHITERHSFGETTDE